MRNEGQAEVQPIYVPSAEAARASQIGSFMRALAVHTGLRLPDHAALQAYSIEHWRDFWAFFVQWCRAPLALEGDADPVCLGDDCEHATFFPALRLNYADALLNFAAAGADAPALTACHLDRPGAHWTRGALREQVARVAMALRELGIQPGDRVAAVLRNDDQAVIAALAVTALGATLATASPDMGVDALLDRFGAIAPTLFIAHVESRAHDTGMALPQKVSAVAAALPSLRMLVRIDGDPLSGMAVAQFDMRQLAASADAGQFDWPKLPFNHPLFIMFTSGTTGRPKCIVHGAGGSLLEHVKEHRLHTDLRPGDRLFFHTSCSWMMWNWQLSALGCGAEIVAYDGPIATVDRLWQIVADERVTVFGTSAPYLRMCQEAGLAPGARFDLRPLRAILSTGSVLYDWQYDWVARCVKHLPLQSISGGTDILGCFVLGSPSLPVFPGEAQCRSLGLDVQVWDQGAPTTAAGQLVCANPFPSRPLGFFGDDDGSRFHAAYFAQNAGVWTHGDIAQISPHGGVRIFGRSDGVLNVRGIKVSPGEIYRVLLGIGGIREVLVVEQAPNERDAQRIVALLVLAGGIALDSPLIAAARRELAQRLSAAHVPDLFVAVPALPTTHSGKLSETAAQRAVNDLPVENVGALRNPECLAAIREHPTLRRRAPPQRVSESLLDPMRQLWADLFSMPEPLAADANFFELGGNSLMAARLLAQVRELTGQELPLATMLQAPTIERFVALLEERSARPQASRLVVPMRAGVGPPVFLVHGLSGTVMECWSVVAALRTARPVYGLQARGVDDGQPPHETVEEAAAAYAQEMRQVQPHGPYSVWGFSFGGLAALEIGRVLAQGGEAIEAVGLIDTYAMRDLRAWEAVYDRSLRLARELAHLPIAQMPQYAMEGIGHHSMAKRVGLQPQALRGAAPSTMPAPQQRVYDAMMRALDRYRPQPFDGGPIVYLRAKLPLRGYHDPLPVWRRTARAGLRIAHLPGGHLDLVREHSAQLAAAIDAALK